MLINNHKLGIFGSILVAVLWMTPASAGTFKPMKFLQEASAIMAIATAIAQLNSCEADLVFAEEKKKDRDGDTISVSVTCAKFPDDTGKLVRSIVRVEFELNQDGSVGDPLGFTYD